MDPLYTRVGLIVDGDNRFFGRSAFTELPNELVAASDALLVSLGVQEVTPTAREVARLVTIAATSPDARVWPLKLTRLLASYGDPFAGHFGGQLTAGTLMCPGASVPAAQALVWVGAQVGELPTDAAVATSVAAWRERVPGGRLSGFGVPFRPVDERRTFLLRCASRAIVEARYWKLHEQVVTAMQPLRPNVLITFAAMLLDVGVRAEHCGIAIATLMSHVFLAHALEASTIDGKRAHSLPVEAISYRGAEPRDIGAGRSASVVHPALRRNDPNALSGFSGTTADVIE